MSNHKRPRRWWTKTAMQRAFVVALANWAARGACNKQIVLPTGRVDPLELIRVVTALKCAGTNRPASSGAGTKAV
jgi:hypothetical protein